MLLEWKLAESAPRPLQRSDEIRRVLSPVYDGLQQGGLRLSEGASDSAFTWAASMKRSLSAKGQPGTRTVSSTHAGERHGTAQGPAHAGSQGGSGLCPAGAHGCPQGHGSAWPAETLTSVTEPREPWHALGGIL